MTAAVPEPELGVVRNAEFHSMGQTMDDGQSYIFNSSLWSLCICQDKGVPISRLQDLLDLSRRCSSSLLSAFKIQLERRRIDVFNLTVFEGVCIYFKRRSRELLTYFRSIEV